MSKSKQSSLEAMGIPHVTLRSYIFGFVFSLYLTLTAYMITVKRLYTNKTIMVLLAILALAQFATQLYFFLHLGKETRPRWKLAVFWFMITIVIILVVGSLWIMSNLNYHMTPEQVTNYLHAQDSL